MTRNSVLLGLAALALAAIAAGGALSATTSVTITTPKANQKVSQKQNPYLAVAGTATFADTTAGTTRFFLRRDGCGTSSDNPHLSVTSGTDGGDGCGLIFNAVAGPGGDVGPAGARPARDGPRPERLQRLHRPERDLLGRPAELHGEREQDRPGLGRRQHVLEPGCGAPFRHELERRDPGAGHRQAHDLRRVDTGLQHVCADERYLQRDEVRGKHT